MFLAKTSRYSSFDGWNGWPVPADSQVFIFDEQAVDRFTSYS
jgi:hypothetical protein